MLIDTHSHVYLSEFKEDRIEMIERAIEEGVDKILLPNIDASTIKDLDSLCLADKRTFRGMMGLHPGSVKSSFKEDLSLIKESLFNGNYCAVGEIGIDLYWDKSFIKEQIIAFTTQIEWALELDLPIAIHARDSFNEIFEAMSPYKGSALKGVFHCFTGGAPELKEALSFDNFMLGIGGVLTFKNSGLDKTIAEAPLDRLVLETDSPYLAPVPYRGKRNEPSYIRLIAEKLAIVKGESIVSIERITSANAMDLFNIRMDD